MYWTLLFGVFFFHECIECKHPASGVPLHATLMQPRTRNHVPTRMGPLSEVPPAGACRNVRHIAIGILRTRDTGWSEGVYIPSMMVASSPSCSAFGDDFLFSLGRRYLGRIPATRHGNGGHASV